MAKPKKSDTWEFCSPEFAAKIANDISEEIDCGETRAQLRSALHWWAMEHCKAYSQKRIVEDDLLTAKIALQIVLPMIAYRKDDTAQLVRKMADIVLDQDDNAKT